MANVQYRLHKSKSALQPYYWTIVSTGNWKTLATSETYTTRQAAIDGANLARTGSGGAEFMDHTGE